ncbi:hypothetical protein SH661x_001445 [Planctomicrobium sp. SH661]|uniref:hypothetical protein n=1 Tax=Planctomicrobium sp. SH661 TaxID=3448124 RepID=UPI003F5C77ED
MNPFRDTIVTSPWNSTLADISELQQGVFQTCIEGLKQVRARGQSAALLIHGEAGSGKTHLLGRLRRTLTPQAPIATDREEFLFVWVRLQTSPRMIWRTLRRTLVEDWFRPVENGRPQIDRILFHRLARLRPAEWDLEPWYEYMLDEDPAGLENLVEQISQELHLDHNLSVAFQHLAFGRHRRELRAWLAGTSLADSVLERLGLARDDGTEEELEDQARQIVLMLCQLTGPDLPILLSFDQVEALQVKPGDHEALFLFGQTISTLHDSTRNVLIVSSVQSVFATDLKDHARQADYDRMTSMGTYTIDPLNREQARNLLSARLQAEGITRPEGETGNETWPLSSAEFEGLFAAAGGVTPRKLLSLCAHRFEHPASSQDSTPKTSSPSQEEIHAFLRSQLQQAVEHKKIINTPDLSDEILEHGLPLIVDPFSPLTRVVPDENLPDVSLIFQTGQLRLGITICNQSNMTSLAKRLGRLKEQLSSGGIQRLVLLRDARLPVTEGAKKARQLLTELEQEGVYGVLPDVEALVTLDALRGLISDSKSGDLAVNGEAVPPPVVREWLKQSLPGVLQDLLKEIFEGDLEGSSE